MPSFRKPKGSYSRSTPDWFIGDCQYQGSRLGIGGVNFTALLMVNDAAPGWFMSIYGIDVRVQAAGAVLIGPGKQDPLISPTGKSASVVSDTPSGFGTIDQEFYAVGAIPFTSENVYEIDMFPGHLSWQWQQPFPFAVIQPGYSLIVAAEPSTTLVNASFWYRMHPERW